VRIGISSNGGTGKGKVECPERAGEKTQSHSQLHFHHGNK
jgi:hypothetical protein